MARRRFAWLAVAALIVVFAGSAMGGVRWPASPPVPTVNHEFLSPPRPDAPALLWAIGDGGDGGQAARAVARLAARDRPDRLLYLGDVYPSGTPRDFREAFDSVYGSLARVTAPTPGNHDWPNHAEGYDRYWQTVTGARTPPWYSFRVGGWEVLSLNSEAPHADGSDQLRWLERRLDSSTGTCRLAFWHRPLASAGRHGDQEDIAPLWRTLAGRASLVINGHDHDLQRLHRSHGLVAAVTGAGGHGLYDVHAGDRRVAFGDDSVYGGLRVKLTPAHAVLEFVAVGGRILDRSSVSCRDSR